MLETGNTLEPTSHIIGQMTGYCHNIKDSLNCQDTNIIYYWKCIKDKCPDFPKFECVRKSVCSFQDHMAEHQDYVKREVVTEPAGEHFNSPGHSVSDLCRCALERVTSRDKCVLSSTVEDTSTFRSLTPTGMD